MKMKRVCKKLVLRTIQQHTGCTINYLTLQVRDDKLIQSITKLQEDHIIRCRIFVLANTIMSSLINLCIITTNHPIMLVYSSLVLVWATFDKIKVLIGERKRLKYKIFFYTIIHVVCSTLVYQDLLREMFKGKKKYFRILDRIQIRSVQYRQQLAFFIGFFTQAPILIIGTYFQATPEYNEYSKEELFYQYMWRRMYRISR